MSCLCCIEVVKDELKKMKIEYNNVDFGTADIIKELTQKKLDVLDKRLQKYEMNLLYTEEEIEADKVCVIIIKMFNHNKKKPETSYPEYIAALMNCDFDSLDKRFIKTMGYSINQYITLTRIKRAKQMLECEGYDIDEIASILHYSDEIEFLKHFKKETGCQIRIVNLSNHNNQA